MIAKTGGILKSLCFDFSGKPSVLLLFDKLLNRCVLLKEILNSCKMVNGKRGLLRMVDQLVFANIASPVASITLPQAILSVLLFMVIFFGIGFLLNMLLRMTWLMAIVYPIIVILIIDDVKFYQYVTKPVYAFQALGNKIVSLAMVDIVILLGGFAGAVISGFVMKALRRAGYQMF